MLEHYFTRGTGGSAPRNFRSIFLYLEHQVQKKNDIALLTSFHHHHHHHHPSSSSSSFTSPCSPCYSTLVPSHILPIFLYSTFSPLASNAQQLTDVIRLRRVGYHVSKRARLISGGQSTRDIPRESRFLFQSSGNVKYGCTHAWGTGQAVGWCMCALPLSLT